MTPDEAKALHGHLSNDPELKRLLNAPPPGPSLTETGAALGIDYPLGAGYVRAIPLHGFVWLAMIRSPLLGRPEELTDADLYRALWAFVGGKVALRPIMGLDMRTRQAQGHMDDAKGTPELFAAWLAHMDTIEANAWAEYDAAAAENATQYGAVTAQEVLDVITMIMSDARAGLSMLPAGKSEDGKKKAPSTASGSRIGRAISHTISAFRRMLSSVFLQPKRV